jgi:hypothetical protein
VFRPRQAVTGDIRKVPSHSESASSQGATNGERPYSVWAPSSTHASVSRGTSELESDASVKLELVEVTYEIVPSVGEVAEARGAQEGRAGQEVDSELGRAV